MAKTYSTDFQKTVNAVSAAESPIVLLEITHPNLGTPVRVVNDTEDLTHSGNLFQKMAFRISLPDDPDTALPQATLELDNVGRELVEWLEVADWSQPTQVKIIQVMRSRPNTAEYSITMDLTDITMNRQVVSGKLGFNNLLGLPAVNVFYTPVTAPAIF
jgi:hypothetical protein